MIWAPMDVTATLDAPHPPEVVFPWIEDLARYPRWLDIVPRAVAVDPHADDLGPAWSVDLRGRLGPFARAKRLRMVRTLADAPTAARFERAEHDGRQHSAWVLSADIAETSSGTRLTMHMHYGGRLWMPALDRLLSDAIERSRPRLLTCLEER
jgi:hypothetical protein